MRRSISLSASLVLVSIGTAASAADQSHPTVVELYQSQGCSSCPPANANLNGLADRADLLPLSFAVTYWDRLGWKDTFGQEAFTSRQWDYARASGRSTVFTPQMIVNGKGVLVGNRDADVAEAIARFDRGLGGPHISWSTTAVSVRAAAAKGSATVWLVRYDPRTLDVSIRKGENTGRTLPHRNVVKGLIRLGVWRGSAQVYPVRSVGDSALKSAILVQQGIGGPIIAASRRN